MNETVLSQAEAYYTAMANKDIAAMEKHLHPEVEFTSPFKKVTGRDAVLDAIRGFLPIFTALKIRTTFASEEQAIVIYDLDCPEPIGKARSAALLRIQDDLITTIELFFDARPFIS